MNLGDFTLGATFDFQWPTSVGGVPTTLAGSPSLAVYADNNLTEITAGLTLTVDFDGKTGANNVHIVASTGNGFAAGHNYTIWLMAGTVGGITVAPRAIATFSIANRSDPAGVTTLLTRLSSARAGYLDNLSVGPVALETSVQALNDLSSGDIATQIAAALTATIADSVPLDGTAPSIAAGIYMLVQYMLERSVSGTTCSVKKPDGTTVLYTMTLDNAIAPTSITRAT